MILDACHGLDRLFDDIEDADWCDWGKIAMRLHDIQYDLGDFQGMDLQTQINAINADAESMRFEVHRLIDDIEMHTEEDDANDEELAERIRDIAAAARAKVTATRE